MSRLSNIIRVIEELLPSNSQQLITAQVLRNCLQKILVIDETSVDSIKADIDNILNIKPFDKQLTYPEGELTLYDSQIYKFIRQHSGIWTSRDVEEVTFQSLLNNHFLYNGAISPSSSPIKSVFNIMYLATTPGTYTRFDNITLSDGEIAFIIQRDSSFSKHTLTTLAQGMGNSTTQAMSQRAVKEECIKHPYTSKIRTKIIYDITMAVEKGNREYDEKY